MESSKFLAFYFKKIAVRARTAGITQGAVPNPGKSGRRTEKFVTPP